MGSSTAERILRARGVGATSTNTTVSRTDYAVERERLFRQIRGHLKALARANSDADVQAAKRARAFIADTHDRVVELDAEQERT